MDPQDLINWLGAFGAACMGWILKGVKDDIKSLQDADVKLQAQQNVHEVHIARGYVTRAELQDCFSGLEEKLDKIFDRLDGKEDKKR